MAGLGLTYLIDRLGKLRSPHFTSASPRSVALGNDIDKIGQLLDIAPDMLCLHDGDGVFLYVSPGARAIIGADPEDIIGRRLDDFIHPDDRLAALERWARLSGKKAISQSEFRLIRLDGAVIWVEATFSPFISGRGADSPVRFGSAIRDVTRRWRAEGDLRKVRDDLASGVAAGLGTLYRLARGPNGYWQPIFFASNIERVTGYTVASAMTPGWPNDVLSLPNRTIRQAALNKAVDTGEDTAEYDFPTRMGSLIRVRDHIRRWDRSDGTTELVGYMVDITESYHAQRQMMIAQEDLAAIVASSPGVLYRIVLDSQGNWLTLFLSERAIEVFGLNGANTQPQEWAEWVEKNVDTPGKAVMKASSEEVLKTGNCAFEYRFRHPISGRWRWARGSSRLISDEDGRMEVVGYTIDVTEEKEMTNQLTQASKLATLGEMATGMAHELSQPLASISMAAENALMALQSSSSDTAQVEKKLERISEQALRAAKLIDHMRVFGRRDRGEARPIDIAGALDGALLIVQGRLRATKTTVESHVEPNLPPVHGSVMLIEQVLINLIANACDAYADTTSPTAVSRHRIKVTAHAIDESVRISVADQAGGIQESDINQIFEPFFTTKPAGKGTGLGLSISYGIVADMGGTIIARNRDGGAVFEITLPQYRPEDDAQSQAAIG